MVGATLVRLGNTSKRDVGKQSDTRAGRWHARPLSPMLCRRLGPNTWRGAALQPELNAGSCQRASEPDSLCAGALSGHLRRRRRRLALRRLARLLRLALRALLLLARQELLRQQNAGVALAGWEAAAYRQPANCTTLRAGDDTRSESATRGAPATTPQPPHTATARPAVHVFVQQVVEIRFFGAPPPMQMQRYRS